MSDGPIDEPMDEIADVIVVGAGLAGLMAATTAASHGARTLVLDGHSAGGRARSSVHGGALFNQGPHALYRNGAGEAALAAVDIVPAGGAPLAKRGRALIGGDLHQLPVGPGSLARTSLLGLRGKAELARLLARLPKLDPLGLQERTFGQFLDDEVHDAGVRALVLALGRVSTYVADPLPATAGLVVGQLQLAVGPGVRYLHGGWQSLVDALTGRFGSAGGRLAMTAEVVHVEAGAGGRIAVDTADGRRRQASSVVIAAGGPDTTARLLGRRPAGWGELGPAVTATCLDLASRREPDPPVIFGLDEPLYLSSHCPPAQLAPAGTSVVHAMRYGATIASPDAGRRELEALADRAGLSDGEILERRYLHRMVVAHALPGAGGLAGRPAVAGAELDGVFLAGDWVGPVGWLADGALASGQAAGLLGAAHASAVGTR